MPVRQREPSLTRGASDVVSRARRWSTPWLGAICRIRPDGYREFLGCAGALIHPRWVVTVAHCQASIPETTRIVFGRRDLRAETGEVIEAVAIRKHERFEGGTNLNDIALIELAEEASAAPLEYRDVPPDLERPGSPARAWGWGDLPWFGGGRNTLLKSCRLEVLPDDRGVTEGWYSQDASRFVFATADQSAGPPLGQGDSGGPVVADAGTPYAIGIISYIAATDGPRPIAVHTRVSAYRDWIKDTIGRAGE